MSSNISECHLYEEMEPFTYFYYLVFSYGNYWKLFRTVGIHTEGSETEVYEHLLNQSPRCRFLVDFDIAREDYC